VGAIGGYVADQRSSLGRAHAPRLLFHDTHHRAATAPDEIEQLRLEGYDGVLAFGDIVRDLYLQRGWTQRAWTWHEAADTTVFRPMPDVEPVRDLVWIGNWGDEERTEELRRFLLEPVKQLGLSATVYGVRYPDQALRELEAAGITYGGYLPNHRAPDAFAQHRLTVHVPRRPYTQHLPGIPTIRPFEALACGIPLISAPWDDAQGLFRVGEDLLMVQDTAAMIGVMQRVLHDAEEARQLRRNGLQTIRERHTCAHRALQLLNIARELELNPDAAAQPAST
jgi:spore maturation protein CgeB